MRQGTYYVSTVMVERLQEDGTNKRVKEQYAIDAISFSEAEAKTYEEVGADAVIKDITIAPYRETFLAKEDNADKFYRTKVRTTVLDEYTNKEKKQSVCYLVRAASTIHVEKIINEAYAGMMQNYTIESIVETKILDIIYDI